MKAETERGLKTRDGGVCTRTGPSLGETHVRGVACPPLVRPTAEAMAICRMTEDFDRRDVDGELSLPCHEPIPIPIMKQKAL